MEKTAAFAYAHRDDDTARLALNKDKWPDIDIHLAIESIESRKKLKNKVQAWYSKPELIFPARLSAEQCSSTATGLYKAEIAARIAEDKEQFRIADLTGGLGVDSWFFSKKASEVLYNEMQTLLCDAASHNFKALDAENIRISNLIAAQETIGDILDGFKPDIVYIDPARRGEGNRKVFLIEECTPDVLTLRSAIFERSRHILIKLSPMADITMVCNRLGNTCREVHTVAYKGECKEILIWMDREWSGEYSVIVAELPADYPEAASAIFSFKPSEEKAAAAITGPACGNYLFEPGKAMMKSGCFNLISRQFGIRKIGQSTHYYLTDSEETATVLKPFGKVYKVISCEPLDKQRLKAAGKAYPRAEVTARNIPMDTETLRKKAGVTSGDDAHLFGLKSDREGNLLYITSRYL